MRCESCGAHNPEAATWCTQCYAPVTGSSGPQAAGSVPAEPASSGPGEPIGLSDAASRDAALAETEEAAASAEPGAVSSQRTEPVQIGDVREVDGVIEWRCATCRTWVLLELSNCRVCGAPRVGFGDTTRPDRAADLDRDKVLVGAAAFPGVGHLMAGRTGSGLTRLVLGLLWLVGGISWLVSTTAGAAPGALLIVGALVLWVVSFLDVQALLDGRKEPFGVRGLLWLVVGVTALLMLAVAWLATGSAVG
jgi:hypothetical protein